MLGVTVVDDEALVDGMRWAAGPAHRGRVQSQEVALVSPPRHRDHAAGH